LALLATGEDGVHHDVRVTSIWSSERRPRLLRIVSELSQGDEALGLCPGRARRLRGTTGTPRHQSRPDPHRRGRSPDRDGEGTRAGKPPITWRRGRDRGCSAPDGLDALATDLPQPKGGRSDAREVLRIYKDPVDHRAIATEREPSGPTPIFRTTTTLSRPSSRSFPSRSHLQADRS